MLTSSIAIFSACGKQVAPSVASNGSTFESAAVVTGSLGIEMSKSRFEAGKPKTVQVAITGITGNQTTRVGFTNLPAGVTVTPSVLVFTPVRDPLSPWGWSQRSQNVTVSVSSAFKGSTLDLSADVFSISSDRASATPTTGQNKVTLKLGVIQPDNRYIDVNLKGKSVGGLSVNVERRVTGQPWKLLAEVPATQTVYRDTNQVMPDIAYFYRLSSGRENYSEIVTHLGESSRTDTGTDTGTGTGGTGKMPTGNGIDIENYFSKLHGWESVSPPRQDGERETGRTTRDGTVTNPDNKPVPATCTTKSYSLTSTPEKVVMLNPTAGQLYPGAIIQGKSYYGGNPTVLPVRRADLTISDDLAYPGNTVVVKKPTMSAYMEAYNTMLKAAKDNNVSPQGNIFFDSTEIKNTETAFVKLDVSAKFSKQSVGIVGSFDHSDELTTLTAVFQQRAHTISIDTPEGPADFFDPAYTLSDLKALEPSGQIGMDNPPVYVSSVTYGRILIFSMTSKEKKADLQAALNYLYGEACSKEDKASDPKCKVGNSGVSVELEAKYKKILKESQVRVVAYGGNPSNIEALIKSAKLSDYFSSTNTLDQFVPTSYVLRSFNNSIAKIAETTNYSVQECTPKPVKAWKVRITVDHLHLIDGADSVGSGDLYGTIKLNGRSLWDHENRDDYIQVGDGEDLDLSKDGLNQLTVIMPVDPNNIHPDFKPLNIKLEGWIMDNDPVWNPDDEIAAPFSREMLGYDATGRDILFDSAAGDSKLYSIDLRGRPVSGAPGFIEPGAATLYYKVERLEPIYE
ncbi:MAG: thiol-activated cytolysin family protein [Deinococcaceae bacterium]